MQELNSNLQALEEILTPVREKLGFLSDWLITAPTEELELVPATTFLDESFLRQAIEELAQAKGITDLKVAASLWDRTYTISVVLLPLFSMVLGGVALDVRPENISLVRKNDGFQGIVLHEFNAAVFLPRCPSSPLLAKFPHKLASLEELHQLFWHNVVEEHMAAYIERMHTTTHLSRKILWGNLGNVIYSACGFLQDHLEIAAVEQDRAALLDQPNFPTLSGGKNPVYRPVIQLKLDDPVLSDPVPVRTTCCILYRLPAHTYCSTCPLPKPAERLERWKQIKANQNHN